MSKRFIVEDQGFTLLTHHFFDTLVALRKLRNSEVALPARDDVEGVTDRLEKTLGKEGWKVLFNEAGDINRVALIKRDLPPEEGLKMFQAIAPCVRRGSFLHIAHVASGGHDETTWSWDFNGRECQESRRLVEEDLDDDEHLDDGKVVKAKKWWWPF